MSLIHREDIRIDTIGSVEELQKRLTRFMRDAKTLNSDSTAVYEGETCGDAWGHRATMLTLCAYRSKGHTQIIRKPRSVKS